MQAERDGAWIWDSQSSPQTQASKQQGPEDYLTFIHFSLITERNENSYTNTSDEQQIDPLSSQDHLVKNVPFIFPWNPISRATPFFLTCKEQRYLALAPSCETSRYYITSQMSGPLTNHLSELLTAVPVRPRFFCCMPPHHHQSMWRQAVHEGGVCPGFTPACQQRQFPCCVFG